MPTRSRASARRGPGCSAWPRATGRCSAPPARTPGAPGRSSRSSTPSTTAAWRRACSTWRGATTPSACTCTWASGARSARSRVCDRLRPCCRSCWRSRPTRPSWTDATPGSTPCAPRSSPRASPAAGSRTPSAAGDAYADYVDFLVRTNSVVEQTQIWWSIRPHHGFGTVEFRICDAQTCGDGLDRAGRADRRLHRPGGARPRRGRALRRPARPGDRGELLARDPPRARREADRPGPHGGVPGGRGDRPAAGLDRAARAGGLGRVEPAVATRTAPSASAGRWPEGATMQEVFAAEVAETQRTYSAQEVRT